MPKSHCAEYTPNEEELAIQVCSGDHSWSFLVILAMTMAMTINSNSVIHVSVASAGWYESVEHMFKYFVYPAMPSTNTFHSWLCTLKTCSYLLCRTAYMLYSSHSYCIPGCSNFILRHLYMTVRLGQTRRQCEIRWMELEWARDCCKVNIPVNSSSYSY